MPAMAGSGSGKKILRGAEKRSGAPGREVGLRKEKRGSEKRSGATGREVGLREERRGAGKRDGGQKHRRPAGRHLLEQRRCPHCLPPETSNYGRWILGVRRY
jgi:hypothetical protein